MSFTAGTRIGPYEITSPLGEGGMGVVYRAHDTKLGRDVAIKALPDAFANDPDRLQRFQREAQVLASLNHPNIAQIYGLEESDNTRCIVMELVEGETLQERLKRGPIPIEEALSILKQLAEALEAAHRRGVIHRDLKPANVTLSRDGKVKVLDFGLAKALQEQHASNLSNSPTLVSAASIPGVILGTAAYMSPEQARGSDADNRSAAGDLRIEIENVLASPLEQLEQREQLDQLQTTPPDVVVQNGRPGWVGKGIVAVLIAGLVVTLTLWAPWRTAPSAAPLRLSVELGADVGLASDVVDNSALALSADGSMLAFVAAKNGAAQIYIRRFGQLQASPLAGTSGALSPFFSPDGQWLAFFADGKLKKISVTGGAAVTLADAPRQRGGSWGDDGNIVFTPSNSVGTSLQRVSSVGGKIEPLTKLAQGEGSHRWPVVLPGAKAVLYTSTVGTGNSENSNIVVQPLPTGTAKVLVRGGYHAQYAAGGHLLYIHEGTLFAAPFDLRRLEVTGQSVPAVEGVSAQPPNGAAEFTVSQTGEFAYLAGQNSGTERPVVWMTHDGKTAQLRALPSDWSNPHFSPDGQRLAMDIFSGNPDVWIYEWARDTLTRLTFDPAQDRNPVWTPDGKRIAFGSNRKGTFSLYWQRADGTGEVQRLTESSNTQYPSSFHPSGKYLAFWEESTKSGNDLMILPIEGNETAGWKPGKPSVFLGTPANEAEPMFSPDGRWIAYTSNESDRPEVYVRPFPGPGGKWQISTGGGFEATWSKTRRELLYRAIDNRIMVVSYTADGDSFKADKPRLWSDQAILARAREPRFFDLHSDGERVAVAVPAAQADEKLDRVTFIFNFFDELRRIAPPAKK
jgi:serine/threonine-protein kinase